MRKGMRMLLLWVLCLFLGACAPAAKEEKTLQPLVDADISALPGEENTYALYFRLGDMPYLAAEYKTVTVERDETVEMALVKQLIAGPSVTQASLQPLFPADTRVMATSKQGNVLFVTFSEDFLTGYSMERSDLAGEEKQKAVQLEKKLCLDALTATLTDAGLCTKVQVLIHRQQVQNNSLRLEEDYLYNNGSALPLPPCTRQEETLYTPYNAARTLLDAWMIRREDKLLGCLSLQGMPTEKAVEDLLAESFSLTSFRLSPGNVSADGQWATVTAEMTLHRMGSDYTRSGYPIRMHRENGVWRIPFDALQSMMTEE